MQSTNSEYGSPYLATRRLKFKKINLYILDLLKCGLSVIEHAPQVKLWCPWSQGEFSLSRIIPDSISALLPGWLSVSEPANLGDFHAQSKNGLLELTDNGAKNNNIGSSAVNWKTTTRYDSVINNIVSERTATTG